VHLGIGEEPQVVADDSQLAYGGQADQGGLIVSVLPPCAFRSRGDDEPQSRD